MARERRQAVWPQADPGHFRADISPAVTGSSTPPPWLRCQLSCRSLPCALWICVAAPIVQSHYGEKSLIEFRNVTAGNWRGPLFSRPSLRPPPTLSSGLAALFVGGGPSHYRDRSSRGTAMSARVQPFILHVSPLRNAAQ